MGSIRIMSFIKIWADHFPKLFTQDDFLEALKPLHSRIVEGMNEKVNKQLLDAIANSHVCSMKKGSHCIIPT